MPHPVLAVILITILGEAFGSWSTAAFTFKGCQNEMKDPSALEMDSMHLTQQQCPNDIIVEPSLQS